MISPRIATYLGMDALDVRERLLDPSELAALLNLPEATLTTWRAAGTGPRFYRVGRHVRYRRDDLEAWLDGRANARKGTP